MLLGVSVIALFWVASVKSDITPGNTYKTINTYADRLQFNVTDLFKVELNDGVSCTSNSSGASYFNQDTPLQSKSLADYGFGDEPEISQFISNQTFYAVYDNSHILIQDLNLDHESFGNLVVTSFTKPGKNPECSDLAVNSKLNRIYVVCKSFNQEEGESQINLIEFDARTGKTIGSPIFLKSTTFKISHRLQIKIVGMWSAPGVTTTYVLVYDQGISTGVMSSNSWIAVFAGADSGDLVPLGYADFSKEETFRLNYLHDIYGYQNQLLVMGKLERAGNLTIEYCGFKVHGTDPIAVNCSQYLVQSVFNTTTGYIGIMNTGQYVDINLDSEAPGIAICNIVSSFYSENFIDKSRCRRSSSFVLPDNVYVSDVEGNVHQVVIKYNHYDGTYAGYSVHNFDLRDEHSFIDDSKAPHIVPIGKSLIKLSRTSMNITRQVAPYIYVDLSQLADDQVNYVKITCQDGKGGQASNTLEIMKMSDMRLGVDGDASKIQKLATYEGDSVFFQLDANELEGNDLTINVDFEDQVRPFVQSQVIDTVKLNVDFVFHKGINRFSSLHFSGRYAIAQDFNYNLLVFNCSLTPRHSIYCIEAAFHPTSANVDLKDDTAVVLGYLVAWSVDKTANVTTYYVFDNNQKIYVTSLAGMATDAMITEIDGYGYLSFTFPQENVVKNFYMLPFNPKFYEIEEIDLGLSGRDYFCPTQIWADPNDSSMIEILNQCEGKAQGMLKYEYPPRIDKGVLKLRLVSSVPINLAYEKVQVCSLGSEYVIFSQLGGNPNLRSVGVDGDRNSYGFGLDGLGHDDFGIGTLTSFYCAPKVKMFTTTSISKDGKTMLAVWWGNSQNKANRKLSKTIRSGLDSYWQMKAIKSFDFLGQLVHTLDNKDGTFDFMFTMTEGPIVRLDFMHGINRESVEMVLKLTNGRARDELHKEITLLKPRTDLKVEVKNFIEPNQTGNFKLEDLAEIKGVLTKARVSGSDLIELVPRVNFRSFYEPTFDHWNNFNRIENFDQIVVGVHTSPNNVSIFTIFHNTDTFVGHYTPKLGVHAFAFAPFIASDKDSILIAYSAAEPTNSGLHLAALNKSTSISTADLATSVHLSMIRVLPSRETDSWIVIGNNVESGKLLVFKVDFKNNSLTCQQTYSEEDVFWFASVYPQNSEVIYVLTVDFITRNDLFSIKIDPLTGQPATPSARFIERKNVEGSQGGLTNPLYYRIDTVFCQADNSTSFYCLVNYEAPFVYEYQLNNADGSLISNTFYFKLPGYRQQYLHGSSDFFVQLAETNHFTEVKYVVYKRKSKGGHPDVYYALTSDAPRSFCLVGGEQGQTSLLFLTGYEMKPLAFFDIQPFELIIRPGANISEAILDLDGIPGQSISHFALKDLIDDGGDDKNPKPAAKWWPFVSILAVLILLSVGYMAFNYFKSSSDSKEDASLGSDRYVSLKPESNAKGIETNDDHE